MLRSARILSLVLAAGACGSRAAPPAEDAAAPAATIVETASSAPEPPPPPPPATCEVSADLPIFVGPRAPKPGAPLVALAHADADLEGASLAIVDASGAEIRGSREAHGGPPFFLRVEVPSIAAGQYRAIARAKGRVSCAAIDVGGAPPPRAGRSGAAWPVRAAWDRAAERLYSAFVELLFDAPTGADLVFPALHDALRDPARNLLHDYLGEGEDDPGPQAFLVNPDCADLPYFLRAYFAHKMGLPFGFSSCTRGGGGRPPSCRSFHSNLDPASQRRTEGQTFNDFLRVKLADTVHSGTGRTPAGEDTGDYYAVPLSFESLRPGTVYVDPFGHVLVVAKRIPQTKDRGGLLYAVDGQPDGTVARRRFWRGNFLFALDEGLGSPGFKRFRPIVTDGRGRARALGNAEIQAHPAYGDVSLAQYEGGVEGFYDSMDALLSPTPVSPERALSEAIDALDEQVRGRVVSVANAKRHFAAGNGTIEMPDGPAIFETTGPWEDYSTPSRDLRLLIAIDVVLRVPSRVAKKPERYALSPGAVIGDLEASLTKRLQDELGKRAFAYERSDGSSQSLTLLDVVSRAAAFEVAYDPNDCPEIRWGAPPDSDEHRTCRRRAPGSHAAKMRRARPWFRDRKRPPRG